MSDIDESQLEDEAVRLFQAVIDSQTVPEVAPLLDLMAIMFKLGYLTTDPEYNGVHPEKEIMDSDAAEVAFHISELAMTKPRNPN